MRRRTTPGGTAGDVVARRTTSRWALVAVAVVAAALVSGVGPSASGAVGTTGGGAAGGAAGVVATAPRGVFSHPLRTDSTWFPLTPGTRTTYRGTVTDETGTHQHTVVFTVTDLVKQVGGTTARVVLDVDTLDGVVSEAELAFFAQDDAGNVWTMGEYPEEYEDGHFARAPSVWVSGVSGARGGVLVPGHPRVGARFVQGRAPAVDFFDVGEVTGVDGRVCTVVRCYGRVATVTETAPDQPDDGFQVKEYAPGTGLVKVRADGGGSQERMTLSRVDHLGPVAMAAVRYEAQRLEARAYRLKADYRTTPPAHLPTR